MACVYIADSSNAHALLLARYRAALLRAVRRLRPLVGSDWAALNQPGELSAEQLAMLTGVDQPAVDELRGFIADVLHKVLRVLQTVQEMLQEGVWERQEAAVRFASLWRGQEGGAGRQRGAEEGDSKKQRRSCAGGGGVLAADAMAVDEEDVQAADGSGGSCQVLEQEQKQQQQLTSALHVLVLCSKQRTDLQHVLRASRRQL
ncbi:hypothetical protein COO60DRAFT_1685184 [Scenedesmus sp. NREL 46B-D3]|nr:hypothetical protein COO60DRAFT_1685184 [Scenedesmus sp. NREL 46B-D3]